MRWWSLVLGGLLVGCGEGGEGPTLALHPEQGTREEQTNPVQVELGPEDEAYGHLRGTQDLDGVGRLVAPIRGVGGTAVEGVVRFDRVEGGVRMVGTLRGLPAGTARAAVHAGTGCGSVDAMGPELQFRPERDEERREGHDMGQVLRPDVRDAQSAHAPEAAVGGQVSGDLVERVQVGAGETATVRAMLEDVDLSQLVGRTVVVEVQGTPGATLPGNLAGCGVLTTADQPG